MGDSLILHEDHGPFITGTDVEDGSQAILALQQEVDRLRGIGSTGGLPPLDFDFAPSEPVHAGNNPQPSAPAYPQLHVPSEPELPSGVMELDSAQEMLLEKQEQQRLQRQLDGRAGLQAELESRETEAREERAQLNAYLQQLQGREDEAGDEIRGEGFERAVEQLATAEQCRRGVAEAQQGLQQMLALTSDPQLREQLLEVQRLDEMLARKTEAEAAPPPAPPAQPSLATPTPSEAGSGVAAAAAAKKAPLTSRLSAADHARLDRLASVDAHAFDDENNPYASGYGAGHGFGFAGDDALQLAEVEEKLRQLRSLRSPEELAEEEAALASLGGGGGGGGGETQQQLQPQPQQEPRRNASGRAPKPGRGGGAAAAAAAAAAATAQPQQQQADHLAQLKEERADKEHLQKLQARLEALHATPPDAPPTAAEAVALESLLARLRQEAAGAC